MSWRGWRWLPLAGFGGALAALVAAPRLWPWALYPRATPAELLAQHLLLVGLSSLVAVGAGLGLGIAVTRPWGRAFLPLARTLASVGQTFPPTAVLILMVPALGFGLGPAWVALALYGVLPVFGNTVEALLGVSPATLEAALGLGFRPVQTLWRVELPLARPLILAGIRTSMVVNVGTAAIGAAIGAGGLGAPILSGLVTQNNGYLAEGAILAGLLALTLDAGFGLLGSRSGLRLDPARARAGADPARAPGADLPVPGLADPSAPIRSQTGWLGFARASRGGARGGTERERSDRAVPPRSSQS
jgi:osmoprotectant transport system permease protein